MDTEQPDIKPLQNGFPPIHLLPAMSPTVATSVASAATAGTSVPVSIIPVFQPNIFPPGIIGVPLTLNQQAILQANFAAAKASASGKTSGLGESLKQSIALTASGSIDMKLPLKRKYSEVLEQATEQVNFVSAEALANIQPRTSKGKLYSWMQSSNPKRQRAKITEDTKKEIIQFCKNHTLLKQGEIADIFGVDRTTVTKMLKRSQENSDSDFSYNPIRHSQHPQFELEDMLYRWITNATKHTPPNTAVWSCEQLQEQMLKRSQENSDSDYSYNPIRHSQHPQFELEDMLYRWITNATKHTPPNTAVWSCEQLQEQAEELQHLTEAGNSFSPTDEWLLDFVERFRITRLLTDYPTESRKLKSKGAARKVLPKPNVNVRQIGDEDLTNAQLSTNHKIPRERIPEYTIVETPLDIPMKIEPPEEKKEVNVEELSSAEAMSRDVKQLEKFREQQKAIEEANKLKKDLLAKTLTERKQRAKKEHFKLEHIQKELSKLDHLLTADVNVVREKIEDASREFMEAQKRFQRAEKEYIESKIDLHTKSELKESLTEHLYTIIHQNEVRKAKKLADLMKELEMENGDDADLQLPELPPLSSFQQTNIHVSPTTGQTTLEHSNVKVTDKSQETDSEKVSESCDKNSNTIVILPSTHDNTSNDSTEVKSTEIGKDIDSSAENQSQNCEKVVPSFTIVEDGEPVSIVYDVEQDTAGKESTGDAKTPEKESQNNSTDDKKSENEPVENTTPKVKTKWDFDGVLS